MLVYAGTGVTSWGVGQAAYGSVQTHTTFPGLDSQSAQDLAVNPVFHKRSKHIAIKFHWVREHVNPDGEYGTALRSTCRPRTRQQTSLPSP